MDEIAEFGILIYREGVAIIPWMIGAFAMWFIYKLYPHFLTYFDEKTQAHRESVKLEAERGEVIRNNTAAINNNTAVLEGVTRERSVMLEKFEDVEAQIQLYDARIEAKIENQNRDMLEIGSDIKVIKENQRTKG